jgi:hypothetical protein
LIVCFPLYLIPVKFLLFPEGKIMALQFLFLNHSEAYKNFPSSRRGVIDA